MIVSYDISDDKRRLAVGKELLNFGCRVQKSVFECYIDEGQYADMKRRIESEIDTESDHVRFYRLCKKDEKKAGSAGVGVKYMDDDYYMV